MGDMADYLIEQGQDAYDAHLRGECDGPCQYCEQEERKEKAAKRKAAASTKETAP